MTYEIHGDVNVVSGFEVGRYIGTIRNKAKQEYARAYYAWCLKGRRGNEPDSRALSYMAAQAVRMRLNDLLKGTEFEA